MALLEVKDLHISYGAIKAIKGISFEVNKGEIVTLIGANGAGKTTTLHAISGLIRPTQGSIVYSGTDIVHIDPSKILKLGLAQVPEGRRVFSQMTVKENLDMGAFIRKDGSSEIEKDRHRIYELLPRLKERKKQMAGTLSGGEQQMLAIGRALMSNPEMLLLDEPSMGLAPLLVEEIFKIIKEVNESGVTVLLVEQNAKKALAIAERAYVLETGKIVMQGNAKEIANNPDIKKAYLGG